MLTGHCQYNSKTPKNTMKEGLKQWIVGALVGMAGRFQGSDLDELLKLEPSDISEIAEALHERLVSSLPRSSPLLQDSSTQSK